jgi:hypothetical protein
MFNLPSSDPAERRAATLGQMIARLDIDVFSAAECDFGSSLRTAVRRCQRCPQPERCAQWLADAPDRIAAAPAFCPNRELFASLR